MRLPYLDLFDTEHLSITAIQTYGMPPHARQHSTGLHARTSVSRTQLAPPQNSQHTAGQHAQIIVSSSQSASPQTAKHQVGLHAQSIVSSRSAPPHNAGINWMVTTALYQLGSRSSR